MPLPNFPTPHCHIKSLDSASTPKEFVKREKELGTGVITVTDHGSLGCCREVYDLAKKNKLTPILGVESYFRDDNCPILRSFGIIAQPESAKVNARVTVSHYAKYFHITLHAMDQEAYEALVRILSRVSLTRMERHGSEEKPLFNWADLEELATYNITFTTGCLVGMVQRHLLVGRPDIAEAYYSKLVSMVRPGNLYVEVFPHKTDKNWVSGYFLTFEDGSERKYYEGKKLRVRQVEKDVEITAKELEKLWNEQEPFYLMGVKNYNTWEDMEPKRLTSVRFVEDFIQNECFPWCPDGDSQKGTNRAMLMFAKRNNVPVLISDDSHFAYPDEKPVQDIRLRSGGDSWRFYASYHRFSSDEAWEYFRDEMGTEPGEFVGWLRNNIAWSERFKDFKLVNKRELPTKFYPADTLAYTKSLIQKHGRMLWDKPEYVARLQAEIEMLHLNGEVDLLPYFFVDEEVCELYRKAGLLTGPGRGSAAGLLLSYCLGITHIDPLKYALSMERFLTKERILNGKWPDIDQDLPHRDLLVNPKDPSTGWLRDRFGDCVAQISTDTGLKLKSSILDVARVFGKGQVSNEIKKLAGEMDSSPQGVEEHEFVFGYEGAGGEWVPGQIDVSPTLKQYIATYPDQWALVQRLLGLTRQKSRHACAFVIMNEPVSNTIPLTKIGDYTVTQYTAKSVEACGGLKMDFLIINVLNDISVALKLIQERSVYNFEDANINGRFVPVIRQVPHNGEKYDIWDLPQDLNVYTDICNSDTETVFQLSTNGAKQYLRLFNNEGQPALTSIEDLAAFTALDRPGPLDAYVTVNGKQHNMLVEYANRATGKGAADPLPVLQELLPETHGVIVYQEQLQRIYQIVGKTTAVQADEFRVHVGKKYEKYEEFRIIDRDIFMAGATESVGAEVAAQLWDQMYTFGQYGFNKSHAVAYVTISYACAFLKHYFPLEWWTAVLSNADRKEIDEKFWKHCGHLINLPDISKSGEQFEIKDGRIQAPLWLLHGIGAVAHQEIQAGQPYTDIRDFITKIHERRKAEGVVVTDTKGKQKLKLAHSSLHRGVIKTLVIGGAADSLFPPELDVLEKLCLYEQTLAEVTGKKVKAVDAALGKLDAFQIYQRRKLILPAYTEPILPMLTNDPRVLNKDGTFYFMDEGEMYRFVTGEEYERLETAWGLPSGGIKVAVAGYILAHRQFKYQKTKNAVELQIDHDGNRTKVVKWGSREKGRLPPLFQQELTGSIAIIVMSKWREGKPFSVDSLVIVAEPLKSAEEEESK